MSAATLRTARSLSKAMSAMSTATAAISKPAAMSAMSTATAVISKLPESAMSVPTAAVLQPIRSAMSKTTLTMVSSLRVEITVRSETSVPTQELSLSTAIIPLPVISKIIPDRSSSTVRILRQEISTTAKQVPSQSTVLSVPEMSAMPVTSWSPPMAASVPTAWITADSR